MFIEFISAVGQRLQLNNFLLLFLNSFRFTIFTDMIAIPNFLFGAMENWGLITYRDWNLLFKPNASSSANKQRVAEVVSHELAHQVIYSLVVPY